MIKTLILAVLIGSSLCAQEEEEIAFEECGEQQCQPCPRRCCHYRRRPTPEEEYLWHERANSSWPGKRDDNLIDEFLHQ